MKYHPTIRIQGSAILSLQNQTTDVLVAINALKDALTRAAPHGRDYQNVDEILAAGREHGALFRIINDLRAQWEERRDAIEAQS
jgi:hypothetical protein